MELNLNLKKIEDIGSGLVTLSCASCGVDPTAWQTEVGVVFKVTKLSISPWLPCRKQKIERKVVIFNHQISH